MTRFVLRGPLACFSRPESRDRFTYPIPTPSALRGVIAAIYDHPGIYADVRRIEVLKPIQFLRIGHTHMSEAQAKRYGLTTPEDDRRTTVETYLRDPAWVIGFRWCRRPDSNHPFNAAKIDAIFSRRVARGEFYYTPSLGLHQMRAIFHALTGDEQPIRQTRDLGMVLHDIDYQPRPAVPHVFHAEMINGIVEVPSFYDRVLRNRKEAA